MKNQYWGDINDYRLYGLLRVLIAHSELRTAVCWMLTPDDDGGDGGFTDYLSHPQRWRQFDPEPFDLLSDLVSQGLRDVCGLEGSGLLPPCRFHKELLTDDREDRSRYFESFWELARDCDLVFFDPDSGMEVQSKPEGRKDSSKHLYWHELEHAYSVGHSVLVFQYFPRVNKRVFIERLAGELSVRMSTPVVYSFQTPRFAWFLLPSDAHAEALARRAWAVSDVWGDQIRVLQHGAV